MVEPHRIADATDAVAVAKEVTGFGVPSRAAPFVDRITIKDDDTPFLARQLVGTVAWRVEFEDISLTLKSAVSSFQDPYRRSFIVLIQEETGILWSVKSVSDKKDIDLKPEPSAAVAEEQLGPEGEIYVGLAAANPGISFLRRSRRDPKTRQQQSFPGQRILRSICFRIYPRCNTPAGVVDHATWNSPHSSN